MDQPSRGHLEYGHHSTLAASRSYDEPSAGNVAKTRRWRAAKLRFVSCPCPSSPKPMAQILRIAKSRYPNLKLVYLSCRTRAYTTNSTDLNPEPFAFETAFADKWVIEDQINRRTI